ncbi:hypothetical protein [Burkholderia cepacia]|uniref:hypothetical protein n=1 Tax=Burkholderia cepacia TaxID=292 RepID=UPI003D67D78A
MVSPLYTFEGLLTARSHAEIAAFLERHAGNLGYGRFFYSPLLVAGDARHFFKDDHNVVEAERLYTKNISRPTRPPGFAAIRKLDMLPPIPSSS